jgi:hypothetical protein
MKENHLTFGKFNRKDIKKSVNDKEWQKLRVSLKGQSLQTRYKRLNEWLRKNKFSRKSQIQVTNYINALKRAGIIQ